MELQRTFLLEWAFLILTEMETLGPGVGVLQEQAAALWQALDKMAAENPTQYRAFIQRQLEQEMHARERIAEREEAPLLTPRVPGGGRQEKPREKPSSSQALSSLDDCSIALQPFVPSPGFVFALQLRVVKLQACSARAPFVQVLGDGEAGKRQASATASSSEGEVVGEIQYFVNVCCSNKIKAPAKRSGGGLPKTDADWKTAELAVSVGVRRELPSKAAPSSDSVAVKEKSATERLDVSGHPVAASALLAPAAAASSTASVSASETKKGGRQRVAVDVVVHPAAVKQARSNLQFKCLLSSLCLQHLLPLEQMRAQQETAFEERRANDARPLEKLQLPSALSSLGRAGTPKKVDGDAPLDVAEAAPAVRVEPVMHSFCFPNIFYKGGKTPQTHHPRVGCLSDEERLAAKKAADEAASEAALKVQAAMEASLQSADSAAKPKVHLPTRVETFALREAQQRRSKEEESFNPLLALRPTAPPATTTAKDGAAASASAPKRAPLVQVVGEEEKATRSAEGDAGVGTPDGEENTGDCPPAQKTKSERPVASQALSGSCFSKSSFVSSLKIATGEARREKEEAEPKFEDKTARSTTPADACPTQTSLQIPARPAVQEGLMKEVHSHRLRPPPPSSPESPAVDASNKTSLSHSTGDFIEGCFSDVLKEGRRREAKNAEASEQQQSASEDVLPRYRVEFLQTEEGAPRVKVVFAADIDPLKLCVSSISNTGSCDGPSTSEHGSVLQIEGRFAESEETFDIRVPCAFDASQVRRSRVYGEVGAQTHRGQARRKRVRRRPE